MTKRLVMLCLILLAFVGCDWIDDDDGPVNATSPLGELEAGFEARFYTPERDADGLPVPGQECTLEISAVVRGGVPPYQLSWVVPWLRPFWQREGIPDGREVVIHLPEDWGSGALYQVDLAVTDGAQPPHTDRAQGESRLDCREPPPAADPTLPTATFTGS